MEDHREGEMLHRECPNWDPAQRRAVFGSSQDLPSTLPAMCLWLPAALGTGCDTGVQTPATLREPVELTAACYTSVENTFSSSHTKELVRIEVG